MIRESGLAVISADSLADGAEKIVAAVKAKPREHGKDLETAEP